MPTSSPAPVTNRVRISTIEKYMPLVTDETTRRVPLLGLLKAKGRVKTGQEYGGTGIKWNAKVKQRVLSGISDLQQLQFSRSDVAVQAQLGYKSAAITDATTFFEKSQYKGSPVQVKRMLDLVAGMAEDGIDQLAGDFYGDGTGRSGQAWDGFESFMQSGAQTATDIFATAPNGTYGGLSCAIGGVSSQKTLAWTPVIVNTTYNPGSGTYTWDAKADFYLRQLGGRMSYGPGKHVDLVLLTNDAFTKLQDLLSVQGRFDIPSLAPPVSGVDGKGKTMAQFGFPQALYYDGMHIVPDDSIPALDPAGKTVRGYALVTDQLGLMVQSEPDRDELWSFFEDNVIGTLSRCYVLAMISNLLFQSPRYAGALKNLT